MIIVFSFALGVRAGLGLEEIIAYLFILISSIIIVWVCLIIFKFFGYKWFKKSTDIYFGILEVIVISLMFLIFLKFFMAPFSQYLDPPFPKVLLNYGEIIILMLGWRGILMAKKAPRLK